METKQKILLVDDDPDLLDMYREILRQLPGKPEIQTASSGARAIALLESEPYRMLITDLKMPRMDGLQLLSVIRRKHPNLRTVVLTALKDEQFRSRVYAQGVDLFWQKPGTEPEIAMFRDCIQSLLEREDSGGFRGVQSKSLVDIIQIECLSQSSSVLRITNGPLVGKIWIDHGDLLDAEAGNLKGEEAFLHILSWKSGNFELLPAEPNHPRAIHKSSNALLLETAQAFDEAQVNDSHPEANPGTRATTDPINQLDGLEFFTVLEPGQSKPTEARNIENPEQLAAWARATLKRFHALGDKLQVGQPDTVVGLGAKGNVGMTYQGEIEFCIGWRHSLSAGEVRNSTKKAAAIWAS